MKINIKLISAILVVMMVFTMLVACNKNEDPDLGQTDDKKEDIDSDNKDEEKPGDNPVEAPKTLKVQGVTDTEILIGNTAAVSADFEQIGLPFNAAIQAVIKQANEAGGVRGRTIKFISYDDEYKASKAMTYTKKLLEEDKVFAIVGHFGTATVASTVDYIHEYGIPMVYAATGTNSLYFDNSPGNPIIAIQPIYKTDGRMMAARIFNEELFGSEQDQKLATDAKIAVLYTNDEFGNGILEGIKAQTEIEGRSGAMIFEKVSEGKYSSAVQKLKEEAVSVIIAAMNQTAFKETMIALHEASIELPVFTSYVNANSSAIEPEIYSENRAIYANGWIDLSSEEGMTDAQDFIACIANADLSDEEKQSYYTNPFAAAGYIAAKVFIEGLKRVDVAAQELNWDNYIKAMEQEPINIPMAGTVDLTNGKRWGLDCMSLLKYEPGKNGGAASFVIRRPLESLSEVSWKSN